MKSTFWKTDVEGCPSLFFGGTYLSGHTYILLGVIEKI
ncbi:MAG: hypothetical protein PWP45_247 [Tepidanaerobacteraceae bacterium]|nr:hypothetical protein [Tepidanaerobacteraceae bacterium]